jgi:hypothetical protein
MLESLMLIEIVPLGTGIFLPAFVIGYEIIDYDDFERRLTGKPTLPDWFICLWQQAGGYIMHYPTVVGAVLRLAANLTKGSPDLPSLIHGFQLMAEDPDIFTLRREFPVLRQLTLTWGEDYSSEQLSLFSTYLSQFVKVPAIENGLEAFIRFTACNPLDYFRDWNVMSCTLQPTSQLKGKIFFRNQEPAYYVDESNLEDLSIKDVSLYTDELDAAITQWGVQLGLITPPRIYLLWENSD